jgi:hypothetical protein
MTFMRHLIRLGVALVAAASLPTAAYGSTLIDRAAKNVRLEASRNGVALLSYRARGAKRYVRAWGAINAIAPTTKRKQVDFRLRRSLARTPFRNACKPAHVLLPHVVTACKAPDGSYWAVQSWQRMLPNFGARPTAFQKLPELRLSHWSGDPAVLMLRADWSYGGRFEHIYGNLTYRGQPVHGFRSTRLGSPLDTFGRNIYLDTFGSGYGAGWKRENSFLAHKPLGVFCYDLVPHDGRSSAGMAYRATAVGPGATPDVGAYIPSPGKYDAKQDALANADLMKIAAGDRLCRPS